MIYSPRERLIVLALCAAAGAGSAGCGGDEDPSAAGDGAGGTSTQGMPARATRPLRDVLSSTLARLGVEAREGERSAPELRSNFGLMAADGEPGALPEHENPADPQTTPEASELDPALLSLREALIAQVAADPASLDAATQRLEEHGDTMVPVLATGLRAGLDPGLRKATDLKVLLDLAVSSRDPEVAAAITEVASAHPEAWIRRYATWTLASFADVPGADRLIPALVGRLKYERDDQTLLWTAKSLAAFGNYAGVQALMELAARPSGDAAGDAARAQLSAVAEEAGDRSPQELLDAWDLGQAGATDGGASDGLLGETWVLIADLSGEHFQLRGVDDARHTLSRLGPWAAHQYALALEDDDEYVRLHVAQVLERMGPRGAAAYDSLVLALDDPHGAVSGAAAESLVAVTRGTPGARAAQEVLTRRLEAGCPHELKVACVRALGRLEPALRPKEPLLRTFDEAGVSDLKLAAASGLLDSEHRDHVLPWLVDELTARGGDSAGAEALLEAWLEELAPTTPGDSPERAALSAWKKEAPRARVVHDSDQAKKRRAARRVALGALLERD